MPARKKKHTHVVGVFETRARAEQAIAALKQAGFTDDQVGMVARDSEGKVVKSGATEETYADEGAVAGAVAGAGAGALVGAGVLAGVIPVVGPVLAIGALGTILLNAAGGAALAGIAGALIGWGIPEEDAEFYEAEVKSGRYLVTVAAAKARVGEARAILRRAGGHDRAGWEAVLADRTYHAQAGTDFKTLRLHEERLRAEKSEEKVGDVKVRTEVRTERQTVTVPVEKEEVVIEHHPAHGGAGGDVEAREIRIPVSEERVHVSKETVPTEEVTVSKHRVRGTKTVSGEVRKEELVTDADGGANVRHTGDADTHGKK